MAEGEGGWRWSMMRRLDDEHPFERKRGYEEAYIWLSGKVTSNLSQIPSDFSLKSSIPDRVYHTLSKKEIS